VNRIAKNVELSVIMPVHNEAGSIKEIILDYFETIICQLNNSNLIIAEDGSTDGTREILFSLKNDIPINLFSDIRRKGYAKGVEDALKKCDGEWIFFSDSDGQYLSLDFWKLWQQREGHDMIIGRKLKRSEGLHRSVLARGFHIIANNLFDLDLHDADCGFRLIRKDLINSMGTEAKYLEYSYWAEFTIRASLMGFNVHEVPINHATRTHGKTQIYKPSKIPLIVLKELKGLAALYFEMRRKSNMYKN
jgi:glycosyltransferase involved in cell wall biosynthesis